MIMREGNDQRKDNQPVNDEVAAIFVANDGAPLASRDIIIYPRNAPLRCIPYTSSNIDPMCYPILHKCPVWLHTADCKILLQTANCKIHYT